VEDNRSDQVGSLGAELLVCVLADVQKQARVNTRAASGGGEREDANLGKVQDLRVVVDKLRGRRARCTAVVDVVKGPIARGGDYGSAGAIEARNRTQRRTAASEANGVAGGGVIRGWTHAIFGRLEFMEMKLRVDRSTSLFVATGVARATPAKQITENSKKSIAVGSVKDCWLS
jgi:hypothetical protein